VKAVSRIGGHSTPCRGGNRIDRLTECGLQF